MLYKPLVQHDERWKVRSLLLKPRNIIKTTNLFSLSKHSLTASFIALAKMLTSLKYLSQDCMQRCIRKDLEISWNCKVYKLLIDFRHI